MLVDSITQCDDARTKYASTTYELISSMPTLWRSCLFAWMEEWRKFSELADTV